MDLFYNSVVLFIAAAVLPELPVVVQPPDRIQATYFQVQAYDASGGSCGPSPAILGTITNGVRLAYDQSVVWCNGITNPLVARYSVLWATNSAGPWTGVDVGLSLSPRLVLTTNWTLVYAPITPLYSRGYILTSTNSSTWNKISTPFFVITNNSGQVGSTLYKLQIETTTNAP